MTPRDVTGPVITARSGGPSALVELARVFPSARLHLPLETLQGIRNRPETALELMERLPIHWIELEENRWALPLFTSAALCRECAERLSWQTDERAIKTLRLPGDTALAFLEKLLVRSEIDRAILNPTTQAELHLARTDIEAIARAKERASLWFYSRDGRLKQPVSLEPSSFVSSFLTMAGGALKRLADGRLADDTPLEEMLQTAEILGSLHSGPLASLCADIYQLLLRDPVEAMELVVTKSDRGVSVEATPHPGERLMGAIGLAARKHLAEHEGDLEARFHVAGSTIVVSSSRATHGAGPEVAAEPPLPPLPTAGRRRKAFDYIPLEPESADDDG